MSFNTRKLKELPANRKFATFNSDNEDIILGEYLLAILIYNGQSLNEILEKTDEIEDRKEREKIKQIIINMILGFTKLNPESAEVLEQNNRAYYFLNQLDIKL